jgi:hypothetical protein
MNVQNIYKLKTKEDPTHFHKTLGFVCLFNFIYRFYLLFVNGAMDLNNSGGAGMVLVHGLLSCSSMIFHIPSQRNRAAPMIYPEFRLHSIIFAMRSVACFFITYYKMHLFYKFAVCYSTMLLADGVTYYIVKKPKFFASLKTVESGTTMRDMPFDSRISEEEQKQISLAQSANQIGATLYMFGNLDSCFSPLLAIQLAAFLMTLVRKSIITSNMWHISYNISLWSGIFVFNSFSPSFIVEMVTSFYIFKIWRFGMRGNKYIGWTMVFAFMYFYNLFVSELVENMFFFSNYINALRYICIAHYLLHQTFRSRRLFY